MSLIPLSVPQFMIDTELPCATASPDIFFPEETEDEKGRVISSVYTNEQEAKLLCISCPVRVKCLLSALEKNDIGIWGGTTERERRNMKRAKRDPMTTPVNLRRKTPRVR